MGKIGIFWDVENISSPEFSISKLCQNINHIGIVKIRNAFANWKNINEKVEKNIIDNLFRLYHIPKVNHYKNSCDIAIAVNIIETIFTDPEIETFIIISGDLDFRVVVETLFRYNKRIIVIGNHNDINTVYQHKNVIYLTYKQIDLLKNCCKEPDGKGIHTQHESINYKQTIDENHKLYEKNKTKLENEKLNTETQLIPNPDNIFLFLIGAIKLAQNGPNSWINHDRVLTKLKISYPNLLDDKEQIIQKYNLSSSKWFSSLIKKAKEMNIIDLKLDNAKYMIKLNSAGIQNYKYKPDISQNNHDKQKNKYFEYIVKLLQNEPNHTLSFSKIASLCDRDLDITYKDLGYNKFRTAIMEVSNEFNFQIINEKEPKIKLLIK